MRLLWQSNASWAGTGYGVQSKLILKGLKERGHEPALFAFYGVQGGIVEYDGYPCLPGSGKDAWGSDVVRVHINRTKSEVLVTLMDLFVLEPSVYGSLPVPWIAWTPVDHEAIGAPTLSRLEKCPFPVAMSHFGAQQMKDANVEPFATIYHAVDTDVFHPLEREDRVEFKKLFELNPGSYVIGMVMANKGDRKQYPAQLTAIRRWMEKHPDLDVKIFLHTDVTEGMGGWDFKTLVDRVGLTGNIIATNTYDSTVVPLAQDTMAGIYNSMDVLMNCSAGEGFGVPIVEAQACGVPVIAGDYTAMPEIVQNGYVVKAANRGLASHYGWQFNPDVDDMVYRLECVYRMSDKASAAVGRQWVIDNCSVPVILDRWEEVLGAVAERGSQEGAAASPPVIRPQAPINDSIVEARTAMAMEAEEYGTYVARKPEYVLVYDKLVEMGLQDGDRILDLGAGLCDLDRYLRERGWWGTYVPVDMVIDGTDLQSYVPSAGFEFIVAQQVIEHLKNWSRALALWEKRCGGLVITTPNAEVVPKNEKHEFPGQMAHVAWLTPDNFNERGYATELATLTGRPQDTIVAWKLVNSTEGSAQNVHTDIQAAAGKNDPAVTRG
jgi:glycosyltransferase involved in cell wall biosynthesis